VVIPLLSAGEQSVLVGFQGLWADGQVVVGSVTLTGEGNSRAFRMAGGVKTLLGFLPGDTRSSALAVTPDGRVVAGTSGNNVTGSRGFVWSDGVLTPLEDLPGVDEYGFENFVMVDGLSADGTTVVGFGSGPGGRRLVRWVNGQIEVLWNRLIGDGTGIMKISEDGTIVTGVLAGGDSKTGFFYDSMVWREGLGMRSFSRYASYHHGVDLGLNPGDTIELSSMTPNGRYFSGLIYDTNYNSRSFIAYLDPADFVVPEPSSVCLGMMAAGGLVWVARRKRGTPV